MVSPVVVRRVAHGVPARCNVMPLDVPAEAPLQQPRQRVQPAYAAAPSPPARPPAALRAATLPGELSDARLDRDTATRANLCAASAGGQILP